MPLRDLIFGRRARAPGADTAAAPDVAQPEDPAAHVPEPQATTDEGEGAPGIPERRRPDPPSVPGLILGGGLSLADRRAAVLEEVARALTLRHVALIGTGRSARLLVANRRVLAARFTGPDLPLDLDMRHDPASEARAMVLHAALQELLAAPIDLVVETRAADGVYSAEGGLPGDLLAGDVAMLRAAFAPPDGEDAAAADRPATKADPDGKDVTG